MRQKEEKEITVKKEVLKSVLCDVCNKDIIDLGNELYFTVHTYHHRWGNDSIESSEHFDLCSRECLANHFTDFFSTAAFSDSYDIEAEATKFIK